MMLRLSLLLAIGLALLATTPALAADVRVVDPNGEKSDISLDDLQGDEDVVEEEYTIRSNAGSRTEEVTGFSLESVIAEAGFDNFNGYDAANVSRPSGGSISLTNEMVRNAGGIWPDGLKPVTRVVDGAPAFVRPSRGPNDKNANDVFEVSSGPLVVELEGGPQAVEIEASASDSKVDVGDKVQFSGKVVAGDASSLDFEWTVSGVTHSNDLNPRPYEFSEKGRYQVILTAASKSNGDVVGQDGFEIQVGEPRESDEDRDGGGKEDDGTDTGAYDGTGSGYGSGYYPSTGTGYPTDSSTGFPTDTPPAPKTKAPEPPPPAGETVSGEVLSDAVVAEPAPAEEETPTLQTGTEEDEGGGVPGAVVASVSVLSLLGLGAFREVRP
jgi:hypothetical protein